MTVGSTNINVQSLGDAQNLCLPGRAFLKPENDGELPGMSLEQLLGDMVCRVIPRYPEDNARPIDCEWLMKAQLLIWTAAFASLFKEDGESDAMFLERKFRLFRNQSEYVEAGVNMSLVAVCTECPFHERPSNQVSSG